MKTLVEIEKTLSEHKAELKAKYDIKEIGIFGSYVRGEQSKKSDIDILVEFYEVPDLFKFIEIERYLEELIGIKVDLVRKAGIRIELRDQILSEVVQV